MYVHAVYVCAYIDRTLPLLVACLSTPRYSRLVTPLPVFPSPIFTRPAPPIGIHTAPPRPPNRAWEVARTVVAPPSSVVKCLWEVFV